jgi:2-dehydropantoate 2-reductase
MRIVVMGAGGVGGYFGARLAQAGQDVAFIARGKHLAAIRDRGLTIKSSLGGANLKVTATDNASSLGSADIVIFTVKLWDTESAAEQLRPVIGERTVVLPFQNGVDSIARIGAVLGKRHAAGGVAQIAAVIGEPGVIVHTGTMQVLRYGAAEAGQRPLLEQFDAACASAGFTHELVEDIELALWQKFVFLSSFSGITCLTRQPIGVVRSDTDMRRTFAAALHEAWGVGRARGVPLADDLPEKLLAMADSLPAEMVASMLHDLNAGNRLEAPWLSGHVAQMAGDAHVRAPVHATMFAALKPYVEGKR